MKCIDKLLSLLLVACLGLGLVSCGSESTDQTSYDLETTSYQYGITKVNNISDVSFYGSNLCVTDQDNFGIDQVDSQVAGAGGVFNLATGQCTYGQNLFGKMYPASTTKILTCLVAIEQADLDTQVTVSAMQPTDIGFFRSQSGGRGCHDTKRPIIWSDAPQR